MRMKQLSKAMKTEGFQRYEGLDSTERMSVIRQDPIPEVEWWDKVIVSTPEDNEEWSYDNHLDGRKITQYIYNPVPLKPVIEPPPPPPMPLFLTAAEKKKIRRMRKLEKEKLRQDQIRYALVAAPEARVTLNNFARVMGDNLVSNPTSAEAKVREQMESRRLAHEEHNKSRALTPAQKAEKHKKKLHEDTSREVHTCVFRTGDLTDGQRRFKIDVNANQHGMTGCVVICGDMNVVVVEGGPKGCQKMQRLLLNRIQWSEELKGEEDAEEQEEDANKNKFGKCVLAWKGVLAKRKFKNFSFENCRSEVMARKFFEARGLEQYWDTCKHFTTLADA